MLLILALAIAAERLPPIQQSPILLNGTIPQSYIRYIFDFTENAALIRGIVSDRSIQFIRQNAIVYKGAFCTNECIELHINYALSENNDGQMCEDDSILNYLVIVLRLQKGNDYFPTFSINNVSGILQNFNQFFYHYRGAILQKNSTTMAYWFISYDILSINGDTYNSLDSNPTPYTESPNSVYPYSFLCSIIKRLEPDDSASSIALLKLILLFVILV